MADLNLIQLIAVWALPVLFAITVHEASHGYVAYYHGDKTAKMLGRLTLSPHKHIDPIGTILVPGIIILLSAITGATPFLFGWAKPVPVNSRNLKNPRRDMAVIAVAGPLSNLTMALLWACLAKLGTIIDIDWVSTPLFLMGVAGIQINLVLMLLNLLPFPPLDGSKVLNNFLRGKAAVLYDQIEPYGFFILLILLLSGALNWILKPIFITLTYSIVKLFGLL